MPSVIDQLIDQPHQTINISTMDHDAPQSRAYDLFNGLSLGKSDGLNMNAFAAMKPDPWTQHYKGIIATIADGVNNDIAGQQASQLSVTHFITDYLDTPEDWSVKRSLDRVITALNTWLFRYGTLKGHYATHFSCLVLHQAQAHIIHLGHCQIGLIRNGEWISLYQQPITTEDIACLGERDICPYRYDSLATEPGDVFVMSTPGFSTSVSKQEISRQVLQAEATGESLALVAKRLCSLSHAPHKDSSLLLAKIPGHQERPVN